MILRNFCNRLAIDSNNLLRLRSHIYRLWKKNVWYNTSEQIGQNKHKNLLSSLYSYWDCKPIVINYNTTGAKFISQYSSTEKTNENSNTGKDVKVYTGNLTTMVKSVKFFSLSTSVVGILMQPVILPSILSKGIVFTIFTEFFVLLYAVLTPIFLQLITKRYILYMYFNHDTKCFTLATLSLFFRERKLNFTAADVKIPDLPGPFTTFTVHGIPFLLDPSKFTDVSVYSHLMGFDKPLELHLNKMLKEKNEE